MTQSHNEISSLFSPVIKLELNSTYYFCFSVGIYLSHEGHTANEHLVLIHSPEISNFTLGPNAFADFQNVPLRIHSECLFGDVFGSNHCDCAQQLEVSLQQFKKLGKGILFYLRQEGRGIGLLNKIRSMAVPDDDSFRRNEIIGLPGDARDYSLVAQVLNYLGISQVQLLSGNPSKFESLRQNGIAVTRSPMSIQENITDAAWNEIQSKLQRGYHYLKSHSKED